MHLSPAPAVQIDVATPRRHHAGHFYRGDNVVAVRLRRLDDSPLPSVAGVVAQIAAVM
jgi:formylmethanofuran dehydrogenase subunit B